MRIQIDLLDQTLIQLGLLREDSSKGFFVDPATEKDRKQW